MRVTAAMEMVSKGSEGERSVQCRCFLPKWPSFNADDEAKSKAKRTKAPKAREEEEEKRQRPGRVRG